MSRRSCVAIRVRNAHVDSSINRWRGGLTGASRSGGVIVRLLVEGARHLSARMPPTTSRRQYVDRGTRYRGFQRARWDGPKAQHWVRRGGQTEHNGVSLVWPVRSHTGAWPLTYDSNKIPIDATARVALRGSCCDRLESAVAAMTPSTMLGLTISREFDA